MPIFARRRLQSMLGELSQHVPAAKANDLLARLEHPDTDSALGAEAEMALLWALLRVAHLRVEPDLPKTNRLPDALTKNLFASTRAVIEITALSDDVFSGRTAMTRTANIIAGYANRVRKRAGEHLSFEFLEHSYWEKGFHRERCVDPGYQISATTKDQLKSWIENQNADKPERIRITEGKTDVIVTWHKKSSPSVNVHCRMPPVAYDLEDNPLFKALTRKAKQLKQAGPKFLRAVFMVDAGCHLLRNLQSFGSGLEVSGERIIWHALQELSLDFICVFSPYREPLRILAPNRPIMWKVTYFDTREDMPRREYRRLEKLAAQLPRPRFEGYQARQIHRHGGFDPQESGWYAGTELSFGNGGTMKLKLSSRLVLECLAGRIDTDKLQSCAFGNDRNWFEVALSRGQTIQGARFENAGIDEDDDYLVFDLDHDWAALRLKGKNASGKRTR